MVAQTEVAGLWKDLGEGTLNLATDSFRLALSNTAPAAETPNPVTGTDNRLANVTQIAYTNVSGGVAPALAGVSFAILSGEYALDANDVVITASGGTVPTFRYCYIYDDTIAGDPIVAAFDLGEAISLADGESQTIQFDATGIIRLGLGTLS